MITLNTILPAIKTAMQADSWLGNRQNVPTIHVAHSGAFEYATQPVPAVVIAPVREENPRRPVTKNGEKRLYVSVYCYTQDFWNGRGLLGDAVKLGLLELADKVELFLDLNLLSGTVVNALVTGKEFPVPTEQNFVGLNEARVDVEYFVIDPQYL